MKKQQISEFSPATRKKAGRTTIAFRLEDDKFSELSRRAASLGVSPHELARHYVAEILLEREEREELRKVVNALGEHIREARKDIALAGEAILITSGMDEKEARDWTKRNLNCE